MAPLADFILAHVPLPSLPSYLTHYVPGQTPLSTPNNVVAALISYLVVVFSLRHVMKNQAPLKLQFLFQLHNIILSSGSGLLLVLMLEEILPIVWNHGIFYGICSENAWTPVRSFLPCLFLILIILYFLQRLEFYYMINYYIKYVELIDTVFLALKKKPLGTRFSFHFEPYICLSGFLAFLHVFHHSATALLCFTQLNGRTSVVCLKFLV